MIIHKQLTILRKSDKLKKVLIVFDDMIADMETDKNVSSIITELFLRGRKLNISLIFISVLFQST